MNRLALPLAIAAGLLIPLTAHAGQRAAAAGDRVTPSVRHAWNNAPANARHAAGCRWSSIGARIARSRWVAGPHRLWHLSSKSTPRVGTVR